VCGARDAVAAHNACFEHHPARRILRLHLRGQGNQTNEQQLPHVLDSPFSPAASAPAHPRAIEFVFGHG